MQYQRVVWILLWLLVIQVSSSRDDNQLNPHKIIHDDVSKLTDYQKEKAEMFYPIVFYYCPTARKYITRLIVTYLAPSTIHIDGGVSLYQLSFDYQWLATTTRGRNQDDNTEYFTDENSPNNVTLWHMPTGEQHVILQGHTDRVTNMLFTSPTNDESFNHCIISASEDNTLIAWQVCGERLRTFEGHFGGYKGVRSCSLTANNQRLLSISGCTVKIWLVQTGECEMTIAGEVAKFCNHDEHIIVSNQNRIALWTAGTGRVVRQIDASIIGGQHINSTHLVALDEIGMKIFGSDKQDHSMTVWTIDAETEFGDPLQIFRGHGSYVMSAFFVKETNSVVSSEVGNTVCIWGINDGVCTHRFDNCMRTVPGTYWLAEEKTDGIIVFTWNEVQVLAIDSGEIIITVPIQRNNFEPLPDDYTQPGQGPLQPGLVSFGGHFLVWSSDYNTINFFTFTHYKKITHY